MNSGTLEAIKSKKIFGPLKSIDFQSSLKSIDFQSSLKSIDFLKSKILELVYPPTPADFQTFFLTRVPLENWRSVPPVRDAFSDTNQPQTTRLKIVRLQNSTPKI